jgi:molecular chaperone DnaK (HSP70)
MAGLEIIRITNEPVMAALGNSYDKSYNMYDSYSKRNVLVYNLGSYAFSTVSQPFNHTNDTYEY